MSDPVLAYVASRALGVIAVTALPAFGGATSYENLGEHLTATSAAMAVLSHHVGRAIDSPALAVRFASEMLAPLMVPRADAAVTVRATAVESWLAGEREKVA